MSTHKYSRRQLVPACVGAVGILAMILMALANQESWDVDFNQYYAAGKLAGSGHLYDWQAIQALELQHHAKAVPYGRLPVYALIFKSLSVLPYAVARALFFLIEVAAVIGFVFLWPFPRRDWVAVSLCWCAPLAMCLAFGQDSILFLFFVTLGFRFLTLGRDFWAGVAFAVCASKPHIALLLPVVIVARERWNTLWGGVVGGIGIAVLSFAAEGREWPSQLLTLARIPDFDPAGERMPNLRGLLTFFGGNFLLEILLGLAVALAVFAISRRVPLRIAMTLALSGGLLLSHHSYVYDCVLLIPAVLLSFEDGYPEWLRLWALLLITPVPYLLLLTDTQLPAHLLLTGFTTALLFLIAMRLRQPSPGLLGDPHLAAPNAR